MPIDWWVYFGVFVALCIITPMFIRIRDLEGAYFDE